MITLMLLIAYQCTLVLFSIRRSYASHALTLFQMSKVISNEFWIPPLNIVVPKCQSLAHCSLSVPDDSLQTHGMDRLLKTFTVCAYRSSSL